MEPTEDFCIGRIGIGDNEQNSRLLDVKEILQRSWTVVRATAEWKMALDCEGTTLTEGKELTTREW